MKFTRKKELNKLSMVKMHLGLNKFNQYFTTLLNIGKIYGFIKEKNHYKLGKFVCIINKFDLIMIISNGSNIIKYFLIVIESE